MKVSTSILSAKESITEVINKLNSSNTDYLHLDVMDGKFVKNETITIMDEALIYNSKPLDIHLMVEDISYYLNKYKVYHPEYITFHIEAATNNIKEIISSIKKENIKVGISFRPDTNIESIYPYLSDIDLVLVMSVEPGAGGQQFMLSSIDKIAELKRLRDFNHYQYQIEVDGGINSDTIKYVKDVDIIVSGSYITSGNYDENICKLKGNL